MPCTPQEAVGRFPSLSGLVAGWSFRLLGTRPPVLVGVLPLPGGVCTLYVTDNDTAAALWSTQGQRAHRVDGTVAEVVAGVGAAIVSAVEVEVVTR